MAREKRRARAYFRMLAGCGNSAPFGGRRVAPRRAGERCRSYGVEVISRQEAVPLRRRAPGFFYVRRVAPVRIEASVPLLAIIALTATLAASPSPSVSTSPAPAPLGQSPPAN